MKGNTDDADEGLGGRGTVEEDEDAKADDAEEIGGRGTFEDDEEELAVTVHPPPQLSSSTSSSGSSTCRSVAEGRRRRAR